MHIFHSYEWGEKYDEQWHQLLNYDPLLGRVPSYQEPQYRKYIRTFQDGKCTKCGKIKRKALK